MYYSGMPESYGSRHYNTFKRIRKVVYSMWFLIDPCGAHRLSVIEVVALFSLTVSILSFILMGPGQFYAIFSWMMGFIMAFITIGMGCGCYKPREIRELLIICKCKLFHTDYHFLFQSILFYWPKSDFFCIVWIIIGGLAVGGIRSTGICNNRSVNFGACSTD